MRSNRSAPISSTKLFFKIGREHSGAVLIPRKNGEPEGGPPPRCLQLMEFDVLCWALAIAGAIFVSQGEQPGSFKYTLLVPFINPTAVRKIGHQLDHWSFT